METERQTIPVGAKKVFIETWGCQMNVADSEQILHQLQRQNYELASSPEEADWVVLNTCHIREKAKHKVMSRLGRLREVQKSGNPKMKIAVAGCVAQAEGKRLLQEAPNINIVMGPGQLDRIGELVSDFEMSGQSQLALGFKDESRKQKAPNLGLKTSKPVQPLTGRTEISRFVNISQGCNNFCTFCVVPFTRGREISLPPDQVVDQVQSLLNQGASEITLLGQNVNSYGLDLVDQGHLKASPEGPFVDLLKRVHALPGLARLRFTTSNPHDFTRPLAELFRNHPKLGNYIHLPVQSGDNRILEVMKRKVTVEEFDERVSWLRQVNPEMALSTDIIVGFPGETEEEFQGTYDLVERTRFSFIYAFMYSERKGTAAARFKDQIPEPVKKQRLSRLMDLQDKITIALNLQEIGQTREVLVHYESAKEPGIYYGRTRAFRLVRIPSRAPLVGELVSVRITDANKTALVGQVLDS